MIELQEAIDYNNNITELLIAQYQNSTNLQGILKSKADRANDLEKAVFEIRDLICILVATGAQLNIIGKIWNEPRMGMNDEEYRQIIQRKISLKISGTIPEIINILKSLYSATYVEFYPQYPAKFLLITDADITQSELESICPAGVGVIYKKADEDAVYFAFEDGSYAIAETIEFLGPEV